MSKFDSVSIPCLALVKLEEFCQQNNFDRYQVGRSLFDLTTQLQEDPSLVFIHEKFIELRKQEPFISLSLDQERLIYRIFKSMFS